MLGSSFYLEPENCLSLPLSVLIRHRMYPSKFDYPHFDPYNYSYNFNHYKFVSTHEWMTAYFELGPNETNSLDSRYYLDRIWHEIERLIELRPRTNLVDLYAFMEVFSGHAPRVENSVLSSVPLSMFRTHYSVGFCRVKLRRQDVIFAVDGVRTPLVLRKHHGASSAYKVVGECYLWAALELDYWNPGTKKGIWRSRPYDLGQVQTRRIEIC
jgi:hypothetical protein